LNFQGGRFVIKHFGNPVKALNKVFPGLNVKLERFHQYKGVNILCLIESLHSPFLQFNARGERFLMILQNPRISILWMLRSGA
jgi:hypothetical protein